MSAKISGTTELRSVVRLRAKVERFDVQLAALRMNPDFLNRDVNANFSGGEKKRNEILQLSVLEVRPNPSALAASSHPHACIQARAPKGGIG